MVATSETIAIVGAEARLVQVEVHIGQGIPSFTIVGLAARSVKEAEQRTRAALLSSDQAWPSARITANLAPGALRKEGTHFDLPLALGLLAERGAVDPARLEGWVSLGELALDGSVRSVRGALAAAIATFQAGRKGLICPVANAAEALLVAGLEVVPVASLQQCLAWLRGAETPSPPPPREPVSEPCEDLREVRGHPSAKRALEVAAAGNHNLLLVGPPGSGKTMLARRLPGILPPMTRDESLDVTRVYSVAGLLSEKAGLISQRPFRSPHHHVSVPGLIGGGAGFARPGEASLAHRGVLFLDEPAKVTPMNPETNLKKQAAGYFRISRARDEMSAPDIYRGQIEDYCRYKGLRLAKVFEDVDFSGRRGSKPRPGLEALKQGRRDYSSVIVPKLSRFGRSLKDLTELFEAFDGDGVGLVFLDVDVDTGTSTGRLVRNIMASLAEWESDLISDRWKDAHRHLARRGATNGGRSTPYGYRYDLDKKMPVVVPAQARVVKQMYERFLAGESIHVITDDLTARKVPSRDGGHWWRQTVGDMLENPFYAAMRRLDGEVIEASWEPIIDRQAWDKAYALRQAVKQPPGVHPREGSGKYLLSGLLWCQVCGKRAHRQGTVKRPEKHIYLCSSGWKLCTGGSINARRADRLIAEAFLERMSAPFTEHVLSAPESALKPTTSTQEPDNNLEERLRAVDRRMERLVSLSLVADGPGAQKAFQRQAEALESERAHLEEERATRRATGAVESRRVEDLSTLRAMLSDLEAIWDKATISERRDMLKVAVDRVEIVPGPRPKQLHIDWAEWLTATPGTSPDEPQGGALIA